MLSKAAKISQRPIPYLKRSKRMKTTTAILTLLILLATSSAHPYGKEKAIAPVADTESIALQVWYPNDAAHAEVVAGQRLPLVVMSHGASGSGEDFADTAQALAAAGFVVAAITHTGDNYRDNSYVRAGRSLSSRPLHVARALDYMLTAWHAHRQIDSARVGLFGFSAGGFTALVTAGGRPDLGRTAEHCRQKPNAWDCKYLRKNEAPVDRAPLAPSAWTHDTRVKAAVIAAPAVGYAFEPNGLTNVHIPIQLWGSANDVVVADSAEVVRRLLPAAPEYHLVANAGHFAFMRPCDWKLRAIIGVLTWFGTENICADPEGFDRERFHVEFNRSVVRFFSARL